MGYARNARRCVGPQRAGDISLRAEVDYTEVYNARPSMVSTAAVMTRPTTKRRSFLTGLEGTVLINGE